MQHFIHRTRLLEEAAPDREGADHGPQSQRGYACLLPRVLVVAPGFGGLREEPYLDA